MNLELFSAEDSDQDIEKKVNNLKFIDLFAGIGGFHLALSKLGAECVFASEKDKFARQTYEKNFDTKDFDFNNDIRKISGEQIPDHDILCAGFPCQPFSQAGLKKGFQDGEDSERGNLFFCILDILKQKKPKAFILENVRHLIKHDNGKTFATIQELLKEAGYSVHYQVLKASDYNIPQLRPRVFIVGFRGGEDLPPFHFPPKVPLTYTMSDIFGEPCEREVGFTLRVGGKGSKIDDRRNYEFYRVNGEVKRVGIDEAKKMMALPDDFEFPVSQSQAMKQLGNSVCVEVVSKVAESVFSYINNNSELLEVDMIETKRNKGELSEMYALLKVIYDSIISYGDLKAEPTDEVINVMKIHSGSKCIELKEMFYSLDNDGLVDIYEGLEDENLVENENIFRDKYCLVFDDNDGTEGNPRTYKSSNIITKSELIHIVDKLHEGEKTFSIDVIDNKFRLLGIEETKGKSNEKNDTVLSFSEKNMPYFNQGTSIKSFIGESPSLLNASRATNFIYEVIGLDAKYMDEINNTANPGKIKKRIAKIEELGGTLKFVECENPIYQSTLKKVDSDMPHILSNLLLSFYSKQTSGNRLSKHIENQDLDETRREEIVCRLKDFVKATMLGIFPSVKWDGNAKTKAVMLVKDNGDLVFYHTNKEAVLKDFFYQQTFFETASSGKHGFGNIYRETNGKLFFKLNLQLRLASKIL